MKSREKLLIGIGLLLVGGYFGIFVFVMPAIENVMTKHTKLAVTETEVTTLEAQIGSLQQQVKRMKVMKDLPENVVIRTYKRNELQASVKGFVDDVVKMATHHGNALTLLKPWNAPSVNGTAPKPVARKGKKGSEKPTAPSPPRLNIESRGYEVTLQGAYSQIIAFLMALNDYPELVEINEATFQHQHYASSSRRGRGASSAFIHENQPIRVTLKLSFFFKPE